MNSRTLKRRYGYSYLRAHLRTCIVVYQVNGKAQFAKYRKIRDNYWCMDNFKKFVRRQFPTATHYNVYDPTKPKGSNFIRQEKLLHF